MGDSDVKKTLDTNATLSMTADAWVRGYEAGLMVIAAKAALETAGLSEKARRRLTRRIDEAAKHLTPASDTTVIGLKRLTQRLRLRSLAESEFLAHVGGLFDGDGCAQISKQKTRGRNPLYRARLWLSGEPYHLRAIRSELARRYGLGMHLNVGKLAARPRDRVKRDVYLLHTADQRAVDLARRLLPYTVLKRPQMLTIVALKEQGELGTPFGSRGIPAHIVECRERFHLAMKRLNGPGR
jgi:hypothetical protein